MNEVIVKTESFTPLPSKVSRHFVLLSAIFTLVGCATPIRSQPAAPQPPEIRFLSNYQQNQNLETVRYLYDPVYFSKHDKPDKEDLLKIAALGTVQEISVQKNLSEENKGDGCRLKHRFDRKAVLAYEWNRSRISLNLKGLNLSNAGDNAGFKLEYKLRLQPEKTKAQRCRYNSPWQGLLGSGYNEFFVRQEDTVWDEIREFRSLLKYGF